MSEEIESPESEEPTPSDNLLGLKGNSLNGLGSREFASFLDVVAPMPRTSPDDLKYTVQTGSLPEPVFLELLEFFTKKGERVLDLFSGKGRMLSAATHSDREAQGVDILPEWREQYLQSLEADMFSVEHPYIVSDAKDWLIQEKETFEGKDQYSLVFLDPPRARSLRGPQFKTSPDIGALKPVAYVTYLAECIDLASFLVPPGRFIVVHVDLLFDKKALFDIPGLLNTKMTALPGVRLRHKKEYFYDKSPSTLGNLGIVAPNINNATILAYEVLPK